MQEYFFCYDLDCYLFFKDLVTDEDKMFKYSDGGNPSLEVFARDRYTHYFEQLDYYTKYGILVSLRFLECMEYYLKKDFITKTGIVPAHKVARLYTPTGDWGLPKLDVQYGEVSTCRQSLHAGKGDNALSTCFTIAWRSKTGRVYKLSDEDIDMEDLKMWFVDLDVAWVHERVYPKSIPFKLKNLSYELVVRSLQVNIEIHLHFKEMPELDKQKIEYAIDEHIDNFNQQSEQKGRKDGVVHNWKTKVICETEIVYEIDMGSAGIKFFKGLLKFLSGVGSFSKVEVC